MAIPDFQSIMLPLLTFAGDGQEKNGRDAIEALANTFGLTPEERKELIPSGGQRRFDNRMNWARTYLQKAHLLEATGRGKFRITERGRKILNNPPDKLNIKFLQQFAEFRAFQTREPQEKIQQEQGTLEENSSHSSETPQESMETSYLALRQNLAEELLEQIKGCSPTFFERLVVDVLVAMGYGGTRKDAGQAVGQSGDGGIDGIIKEDRLGLDVIYVQAKRWEGTVGAPVVQGFAGALMGKGAQKGVLITASKFSQQATSYARSIGNLKIILIDGDNLVHVPENNPASSGIMGVYGEAVNERKR